MCAFVAAYGGLVIVYRLRWTRSAGGQHMVEDAPPRHFGQDAASQAGAGPAAEEDSEEKSCRS
jgi:hypothetical protein